MEKISMFFKNRTVAMVRNRYIRRNIDISQTIFKNKCAICGKYRRGHSCVQQNINIIQNNHIITTELSDAALLFSVGK